MSHKSSDNDVLSQKNKERRLGSLAEPSEECLQIFSVIFLDVHLKTSSDVRVHPDVNLSVRRLESHLSKCCFRCASSVILYVVR